MLRDASTFVWLKLHQMLPDSPKRSMRRIYGIGGLYVLWIVLLSAGAAYAASDLVERGENELFTLASIAWPLWALLPLLGSGAGEAQAKDKLAPYPVSPRAQLLGSWVSAGLDFPYLFAFPPLFAFSIAVGGLYGGVCCIGFVLGASALGQTSAWLIAYFLAGKSRPAFVMSGIMFVFVLVLAFIPNLVDSFASWSNFLPSSFLVSAITGTPLQMATSLILITLPAVLYLLLGHRLVLRATHKEANVFPDTTSPFKEARFSSPTGILITTFLRSLLRAPAAQASIVGVLAAPFIMQIPLMFAGEYAESASLSLNALSIVVAIAIGSTLLVNGWSFEANGILLTLSLPLSSTRTVLAKVIVLFSIIFFAQSVATGIGVLVADPTLPEFFRTIGLNAVRALVFASAGAYWGAKRPLLVDFDSLRSRVAEPRAVVPYALICVLITSTTSALLGGSWMSILLGVGIVVGAVVFFLIITARALTRSAAPRLLSAFL